MRTKLLGFILLSLITLCWTACDNSDNANEPIRLQDFENNPVTLIHPGVKRTATILGGDGHYSITCDDTTVLKVKLVHQQVIELESLAIGDAIILINDQSGNSCVVNVHIQYYEKKFTVIRHGVKVVGEDITIREKKELEEKALASIPVKINGGYNFVNSGKQKGEVFVYPEIFGEKEQKGTFESEYIDVEDSHHLITYTLDMNGKKRTFILMPIYQTDMFLTKSEMIVPFAFMEDVTGQFKAAYPAVEAVYTYQVLK